MSAQKKFSLNQLALQNAKVQSGLSAVCSFYKNHASTSLGGGIEQQKRNTSYHNPRLTKLIGVKKTLVNQMQGMVQSARPKAKSRAVSQSMSAGYSIYGHTKLFSSMSSLGQGRSCSSSCAGFRSGQRRALSSVGHNLDPVRYIVHQRYHNNNLQEKREEDAARDISQSIKAELMEVDKDTKRLISYVHSKRVAEVEDDDDDQLGQLDERVKQMEKAQLLQRHKLQQPLRYEAEGWHHPRSVKPIDSFSYDDELVRQQKPLRRKAANIRYRSDESVKQKSHKKLLQQPSPQLRSKQQAQLGELYVKRSQQKLEKEQQDDADADEELMAMPATSSQKKSKVYAADKDRRYRQSTTEREFIDRILTPNAARDNRVDEDHYQSKTGSNTLSASQRVINKQYEDYRNHINESRNKREQMRLIKNIVQTVNPVPQSRTLPRPPAAPKSRAKGVISGKSATQLWKRNKPAEPRKSFDRYGAQQQQQLVEKKHDKPKRSMSTVPFWKRKSGTERSEGMPSAKEMSLMQIGEKRKEQHKSEEQSTEYSKQSAVQRLGTGVVERRGSMYPQRLLARQ